MPDGGNTVVSALNELTALGTERDQERLAALLDRLVAARLRVLVVGEAKRGKSTLINALLGRAVLPSGVTPLTAVTTTVRYGDDERAEARFLDGHDEKHPLGEQGLAAVDARLGADLRAELDVLRESAAELLGLDLAVPEPEGRLVESRRFFYNTAEDVGQTELLAGAVRRWLPGEFGRRTAREHLRREAPRLVDSQVGRARGDLQYRLAEATRALERVVGQRYVDGTDRIRSALQAAAELGEASAVEAGEKKKELAEREAALRHVMCLLHQAAAPR